MSDQDRVIVPGYGIIFRPDGMPLPLFRAIVAISTDYDKGDCDFSVTELLKPPQIPAVQRERWEDIEVSASSLIYSIHGSATHTIMERGSSPTARVEERIIADFDGVKVGGKVDYLDGTELDDWKVIGVYEAKKGLKKEKEQQLNMLAHLLRKSEGLEMTRLGIISPAIRDWRPAESRREKGYPQVQWATWNLPIWESDKAESFILGLLSEHVEARDGTPRPCSPGERWLRNGRPARCSDYCHVSAVCPQHQAFISKA